VRAIRLARAARQWRGTLHRIERRKYFAEQFKSTRVILVGASVVAARQPQRYVVHAQSRSRAAQPHAEVHSRAPMSRGQ